MHSQLYCVLIFHKVWNRGDSERVVLIVDVWHPALNRTGRDRVRALVSHAKLKTTGKAQWH